MIIPSPYLQKLHLGDRLRILFVNDVGFQYGAGIALFRQIQSFLLTGHDVSLISWVQGDVEATLPVLPPQATGRWMGVTTLPHLHVDQGVSPERIVEGVVLEAKAQCPDLIILGNLHGAKWPLELIAALRSLGCPMVTFMHDCYFATGRCAYTGTCKRYRTGCDDACPTFDQYPKLDPAQIFYAWSFRRALFCGANGVPLAANSRWTLGLAREALPGYYHADCIYYGLDEHLFKPMNRSLARRLLGIPEDSFVVLGGAVNVNDFRKGGHIFKDIVAEMKDRALFLVFGAKSNQMDGVYGTGFLRDFRKMPLVYSAADVFVGTSLEEAFGQTFCESSACGVPVVAFAVDGIPEVARQGVNARLTEEKTAAAMIREIDWLRQNPDQRRDYGAAGRAMVEAEFTLQAQGDRWMAYLKALAQRQELVSA